MPVISAVTVGTGGRLGSGMGRHDRRAILAGLPAERGRVHDAAGSWTERADLLQVRVEQQEPGAGRVDAEDTAGRFGAGDQIAAGRQQHAAHVRRLRAVEDRALAVGRDLVDEPLVAGRHEQRPVRRLASAQMYLSSGSKNGVALPDGVHLVDAPVGRRADVDARRPARTPGRALRARSNRRRVENLPSRVTFITLPSLPEPTNTVPSGATTAPQSTGASVSATAVSDGPSRSRPCRSIDRLVASPFRKSASVPTSQKRAPAAFTATPQANRQNATGSSRDSGLDMDVGVLGTRSVVSVADRARGSGSGRR